LGDRFVAPSTNQIQSCHKSQDRQAMEIEILPMFLARADEVIE
jgi:hypothetical protein